LALVRGCRFPDELHYDVPHYTWYRVEDDGLVRVGLTAVAIAVAREVLVVTPKRVGREIARGQGLAMIESAKTVFAIRSALDGTVAAINETLVARPTLANRDCYGAAWLLLARPAAPGWESGLVTGAAIAPALEAWMDAEGFPGCAGP